MGAGRGDRRRSGGRWSWRWHRRARAVARGPYLLVASRAHDRGQGRRPDRSGGRVVRADRVPGLDHRAGRGIGSRRRSMRGSRGERAGRAGMRRDLQRVKRRERAAVTAANIADWYGSRWATGSGNEAAPTSRRTRDRRRDRGGRLPEQLRRPDRPSSSRPRSRGRCRAPTSVAAQSSAQSASRNTQRAQPLAVTRRSGAIRAEVARRAASNAWNQLSAAGRAPPVQEEQRQAPSGPG